MDVFKIVNWFRVASNAQMRLLDAEELTQMKVMKLLYYVQGTHLALFDEKAFPNDLVAWKYGPVVEAVHDKYAGQRGIVGKLAHDRKAQADYVEINNDERMKIVVQAVWQTFGEMSAIQLMNQTHQERPWKETPQSQPIDAQLMATYFKAEVVKA